MIHYFNPGHETAVHNSSPYYTAPANVVSMQQELAYLPAWYGEKGDVVLIHESDPKYFNYISENLNNIPKPILKSEVIDYSGSEVSLWGISPQAIYFFDELTKETGAILDYPTWKEELKHLNSRPAAQETIKSLINNIIQIPKDITPEFYTKLEDIEKTVDTSNIRLLAKAPYSSSGRGLLWLPATGLTRTERQILHGILKKQGCVSIERVLEKEIDFAMEFMCDGKGNVSFEGYSLFRTNNKGAYLGNYIGRQDYIYNQLTYNISSSLLEEVKTNLIGILKEKYASLYKGCIGVDMLIYKENEIYKLHPCLEINMRYNMGYLTLKLYENHISPSSQGQFHLNFSAIEGEIFRQHQQMTQTYPTLFEKRKLKKGYLPLCPVNEKSKYWTYVVVED